MDLNWSAEEEAFAAEMRDLLAGALTPALRAGAERATSVYPDHHVSMDWQARLHAAGLAAPHWLPDHGGRDWTPAEFYLYARERARAGAPALSPMGIHMVAHVIAAFGTDAQKEYFLPRILTGEVFFCQGYSEPGAGSDLAALQMSAVPDGDDFVLNGSKIWTTHAGEANWIFCLVRTSKHERPQQGITFLLVPMDQSGVTVRPLTMISGETIQAEVFFDDARSARSNVIGEVDRGWTVAKYLLEFERGGSAHAPALAMRVDALAKEAQATMEGDPVFAQKLAKARIRVDILEMIELKLLSGAGQGESVGVMASMLKIMSTELAQHITELAYEAAGPAGLAFQPHAALPGAEVPVHVPPADGHVTGAPWQAIAPLRYFNERAGSIYAGSNEIQRNILAKAVLGL
ncbi:MULTISPECIES: acyl-CoA dehydrogenase family protein [unclassified Sphingopyxis]|uniref:acyl-CoA dehydrogenase family protein n=1 Tax=unclassified Sphingopyxis TaxID=2614943 RepID=UPI0007373BDB|nr:MULTISPECIES: acyl-CoA dehydrogenase family protein [unclassified Sphingopyxis]KTE30054.1 acyl-CoA dehydrogenase [Sphingopyxis sp. HIX]KTE84784.1 acyl-CoA dehydrogenase [Sphingopyxis sp. HXXIV]